MADQQTLNVNDVFAGTIGKEGAPAGNNAPPAPENTAAIQARQEAEAVNLAQAREVIFQAEQAGMGEQLPVKQEIDGVTVEGTTNATEVAAFSQEFKKEYVDKAVLERAQTTIKNEAEKQTQPEVKAVKEEAGINEIVVNGIKHRIESEQEIQANLSKSPGLATTWLAWWSKKLLAIFNFFTKGEKEQVLQGMEGESNRNLLKIIAGILVGVALILFLAWLWFGGKKA